MTPEQILRSLCIHLELSNPRARFAVHEMEGKLPNGLYGKEFVLTCYDCYLKLMFFDRQLMFYRFDTRVMACELNDRKNFDKLLAKVKAAATRTYGPPYHRVKETVDKLTVEEKRKLALHLLTGLTGVVHKRTIKYFTKNAPTTKSADTCCYYMSDAELVEMIVSECGFIIDGTQFSRDCFTIRRNSRNPAYATEYATMRVDDDVLHVNGYAYDDSNDYCRHNIGVKVLLSDPNCFEQLKMVLHKPGFLLGSHSPIDIPIAKKYVL